MVLSGCPGSKMIKEPIPEIFNCPVCGNDVEIWTHEMSRNCDKCGNIVTRDEVPQCIEWCEYAADCVGPEVLKRFKEKKAEEEKEAEDEKKKKDDD
jgi:hypothetical protein